MGQLARRSFAQAWVPDADPVNGPVDGLLRMDNCVLDELGILAVRPGSAKINVTPFADLDVHSLFTAVLGGTRYRLAGAANSVYSNGTAIATGLAGSGDIAFGSYLGQVFFARSTSKKKYDGATVRNWGIGMTGGAPTMAGIAADTKVLASCDAGEITWTVPQGTAAGLPGNAAGFDGVANKAIAVTPDATTGLGSIQRRLAADTDYSVLAGGATRTDDTLLELYVKIANPAGLAGLRVEVDLTPLAKTAFSEDYYWVNFSPDDPTIVIEPGTAGIATFSPIPNDWVRLALRTGDLIRSGTTEGRTWKTVTAVRVTAVTTGGGAGALVTIDNVRLLGGQLTGDDLEWRYVYVRNDGTSTAKSGPSAASALFPLRAQGATVTVPADASRDSQVNEIWLYRLGGNLTEWLRTVVATGVAGTGAVVITDTTSDADALIIDLPLELTNTTPPDTILAIAGPYYDRLFALTATALYPSRRRTPDTFATDQAIVIAGADETAYWVVKAFDALYVGTSKDIYRLSGTGAELPDGTLDFQLQPLSMSHAPVSPAIAQEGNLLVYLANDGWRTMAGAQGSLTLSGATRLLYRGRTRHGVSAVNLAGGRFKGVLAKGELVAVTPEGTATTSASVLYRHVFSREQWYRHTYTPAWRSIAREPDGTLIAGDTAGTVWILDTGTQDNAVNIPVVVWTRQEDDDHGFAPKTGANLSLLVDTGGDTLTADVHVDGASTPASSPTVASTGLAAVQANVVAALAQWQQVQLRLSGSCSAFRLGGYLITYEAWPIGVKAWDSGPMDLGVRELVWVRIVRLKVRAAATLTVTPYFDDQAFPALTVPVTTPGAITILEVPVGRGYKGHVPRLVISSSAPFYPYWVDFVRRTTGAQYGKPAIRVPSGLGGEAAG